MRIKRNLGYTPDGKLTPNQAKARKRIQRIASAYSEICGALKCAHTTDRAYLLERLAKRLDALERGEGEALALDPGAHDRMTIGTGTLG